MRGVLIGSSDDVEGSVEEVEEAQRRRRLNYLCAAPGLLTFAGLLVYPLVLFLYDVATNGTTRRAAPSDPCLWTEVSQKGARLTDSRRVAVDAVGWVGAGLFFVLCGIGQVISASKLRADHWIMRIQQPGGPLNLMFRSDRRGAQPDVNRNVRRSGQIVIAFGVGMAAIGAAAGLL